MRQTTNFSVNKPLQEHTAIETLSARYNTFLFISPHLDDAVLSCESLIKTLLSHKKNIIVISVFTRSSPPPYTNQAKDFMRICGYTNSDTLFNDRKDEDVKAFSSIGCKHVHLPYVDAAWRKTTNFAPVYPNEKAQFSGRISHQDDPIVDQIQNDVMSLYKKSGNPLLLAPLGIGGHCDHALIHKMIARLHLPSLFWEDYPYNAIDNNLQTYMQKHKELNLILESKRTDKSRSALKFYKTYSPQNKNLFPLGAPEHIPERYYSLTNNIHDQPI